MTSAAWFPLPNLPQHLQNMVVTRSDLSSKPLFVSSKLMFSRSGSGRNFIFLDAHHSPYSPSQYGAPGLLFSVSHAPQWQMGLQSVFTASHQSHKAAKLPYMYVGEYRLRFAPSLSVEEYMTLSPQSKEAHASSILHQRSKEFKELQHRVVSGFHNVQRSNDGQAVHEIVQAYERGSEKIHVWLMECVGIDEGLLQQMHQMKSCLGSEKKASKEAEASATSSTTKSTNRGKGKKKQHR
ncbi:hypothetical protein PYCCODRAFT_676226 [Trametes coccinea BRFM310]|uniref:DUF6697 domain-containing protein n=1 Tax=Trametes coccinea (strain BRFM310) TaxID=1353009 RepID=A0A1Y2IHN4_TRAC3|nr:hypothetical protein PYCCODRAFT_676226 [Trametes coccinea BRFM310]